MQFNLLLCRDYKTLFMIVIADAGSTKTDWSLLDKKKGISFFRTEGFNPYFNDPDTIISGFKKELPGDINYPMIEKVYYYGAGCSTEKNCKIIYKALNILFPKSVLDIGDDLLGAARSLFGNEEGIACILGTGSNSGFYDGRLITERLPSFGYLFGDEGSGAHLGKLLINDYINNNVPEDIRRAFDEKYNFSLGNILEGVYKNPYPNRFLASFTGFLTENIKSEYIEQLVKSSFTQFFEKQLKKYSTFETTEVACIGSVAYHFRKVFQEIAAENSLKVTRFLKNPMKGLIRYHSGIELR